MAALMTMGTLSAVAQDKPGVVMADLLVTTATVEAVDHAPRKVRAVFLADPARLRHEMELSNWQLDTTVPEDAFASSSATSASRIAFTRPDLQLPPGLKPPPVQGKPSTSR
jgi:hypothetical protein